jgi:hypothetical protein
LFVRPNLIQHPKKTLGNGVDSSEKPVQKFTTINPSESSSVKWNYRECIVTITIALSSPASFRPIVEIDCRFSGPPTALTTGQTFLTSEQALAFGHDMAREWIDRRFNNNLVRPCSTLDSTQKKLKILPSIIFNEGQCLARISLIEYDEIIQSWNIGFSFFLTAWPTAITARAPPLAPFCPAEVPQMPHGASDHPVSIL